MVLTLRLHNLQPLLMIYVFLASVINHVHPQDQDEPTNGFIFNGFNNNNNTSSSNLTLGGASIITPNGALKLTNTTNSITGYAFYSSPLHLFNPQTAAPPPQEPPQVSSFSTNFVFQIVPQPSKQGGHGLTFLIAPTSHLQQTSPGPYLGATGPKNDGNASNHMFLVEFNTVTVGGDHLAIRLNNMQINSESAKPAAYYDNATNTTKPIKLEGQSPIQAWIEYINSPTSVLNVTIAPSATAKPTQPLISLKLNLSSFLKQDATFAGFTSATGIKLSSSHYVLGWSFKVNGLAPQLDLPRLPRPPTNPPDESTAGTFWIGAASSAAAVLLLSLLAVVLSYWYKHRQMLKDDALEDWEVESAHRYKYKDLYRATKGFKDSEVIGFGGFGCVYRGVLPKTKETVAIKKILHNSRQGIKEFAAEIASLGRMRHKNLVRLHGWCKHGNDLLLVYDFMPNGSLDNHIFEDGERKKNHHSHQRRRDHHSSFLDWSQRLKILRGIGSALVYLHEECEQVVVHRDVKANNVLLDSNLEGRLGDFGLSRLHERGEHPSTTHIVGTLGYMAPELSQTGKATTQCDVYSFGALLLEVACGRRPIELDMREPVGGKNLVLLDWVREWWMKGCIEGAADPKLEGRYAREEMELVLYLGLVCCQKRPEARPSMRQVTRYLDGSEVLRRVGTLEFAYSDSDDLLSLSSSNVSTLGHGVISSGSFRVGGR